jgi:hypothetical protein
MREGSAEKVGRGDGGHVHVRALPPRITVSEWNMFDSTRDRSLVGQYLPESPDSWRLLFDDTTTTEPS